MVALAGDELISHVPKGHEDYFVLYWEHQYFAALNALLRWVHNPRLSFTYADALEAGAKMYKQKPLGLVAEDGLDWADNQL